MRSAASLPMPPVDSMKKGMKGVVCVLMAVCADGDRSLVALTVRLKAHSLRTVTCSTERHVRTVGEPASSSAVLLSVTKLTTSRQNAAIRPRPSSLQRLSVLRNPTSVANVDHPHHYQQHRL